MTKVMDQLKNQNHILILGFGISGQAAAELALSQGEAVTVFDERDNEDLRRTKAELQEKGRASIHLGSSPEGAPSTPPKLCVISPGIREDSALGRYAAGLDCPVISELEFGFRYCQCPLIAVTGTNGKTTTVQMITHALNYAGKKAKSAGNIGDALSRRAAESAALDWLVVEVSSFQLTRVSTFAPAVAVVLNISPDHLDWHESFEEYARAKGRILMNLEQCEKAVLRKDVAGMPAVTTSLPGAGERPLVFSADSADDTDFFVDAQGYLCRRGRSVSVNERLMKSSELKVWGKHNTENALAAIAAGTAMGVEERAFIEGLRTFEPEPHRLEIVGEYGGAVYINDSKATNPDALLRALEAVGEKYGTSVILIAGGLDKDLNFDDIEFIIPQVVKRAFLVGVCRYRLAERWKKVIVCTTCGTLQEAVEQARSEAAERDVVLLAPGCASQDMFVDYKERGKVFRKAVTGGGDDAEILPKRDG